jgi:hypothetical protein
MSGFSLFPIAQQDAKAKAEQEGKGLIRVSKASLRSP